MKPNAECQTPTGQIANAESEGVSTGAFRNLHSAFRVPQVALVGAGPGHPGLITLRAVERLGQADFVLYDRLVADSILCHASAKAHLVCVEELGPCHAERMPRIQQAMVDAAHAGKRVVRLKGGDPMVFGRGGEEAEALRDAGIEYEIVPGVTAALGVASCAAIPLTHRRHASAVAFVTGHEEPGKLDSSLDWLALARFPGTLVFYMGIARLESIARSLIANGKAAATPAAVVEQGTTSRQRTITTTLEDLPNRAAAERVQAPALVVIGEVVALRQKIAWFESQPLFGKAVLVTRPRHQACDMVRKVESLGGRALVLPTVEIGPPADWGPVDRAITRLSEFDWLVFTSVNGVEAFVSRLKAARRDLRALGSVRLAVIGPATAEALRAYHLEPDLMPEAFNSEGLAAALRDHVVGQSVLLARADRGIDLLREQLSQVAEVEQIAVYSQRDARLNAEESSLVALARGEIDYVSLTSSNIASALLASLDEAARGQIERGEVKLVTISPRTSAAVLQVGLPVAAEAVEYTTDGVLAAMCALSHPVSADP